MINVFTQTFKEQLGSVAGRVWHWKDCQLDYKQHKGVSDPLLGDLVIISLVLHQNEHEGLMHFMQDAGSLSNPLILPFIKDPRDSEA